MVLNSNLRYRRQFITTDKPINSLQSWQYIAFNKIGFHIYAHPDLELNYATTQSKEITIVLLGYAIDHEFPERNNIDIVQNLIRATNSENDFATLVEKLAGRYVFILKIKEKVFVFNDAGGLRSVYYIYKDGKIFMGTQPSIMEDLLNIQPSENYKTFKNSRHYKNDIEYWLPAGATLYKDLNHLIPNHYLDVSKQKQIRFWPTKKIEKLNLEPASEKAAQILKNLMFAVSLREKLAIAITAGLDSRILLAASKGFVDDIFFFTVKSKNRKDEPYDVSIPRSILKKFKLKHHTIESIDPVNPDFHFTYKKNVHLAHLAWAKNLNGLFYDYPDNRISIQGNGSEIARCAVYPDGKYHDVTSVNQFLVQYWSEWKEIPFIMKSFDEWFTSAKKTCIELNMDVRDLFVLEQRTAGWNAQANNESDIVTDSFTPFINRPLLELMLSVPAKFRQYESSVMHHKIISNLWPELLYWPINKRWKKRDRIRHCIGHQLKDTGLDLPSGKVYNFIHSGYQKIIQIFFTK